MSTAKHIIVFSHGFGVRKDDRGLFTDIAAGLPGMHPILFDYNQVDETTNTLTVAPLDGQAAKLTQIIEQTRANNPDATIDLICHSQGCLVAAIAAPSGIRKTIFTAPAPLADIEDKIKRWRTRLGTEFNTKGITQLVRGDGSITIVPSEYWVSLKNRDAQKLYNDLAKHTDLTVITATKDEVLGDVVFDRLSPHIKVIKMATGHNFENESRRQLIDILSKLLQEAR